MKKAIVLVGHGELPLGMKQAAEMVTGKQENLFAVSLDPEDGREEFAEKLSQLNGAFKKADSVFIFADIAGGSPCNAALEGYLTNDKVEIIAGMNFSMVLSAVMDESPQIHELLSAGKNAICNVKAKAESLDRPPSKAAAPKTAADKPFVIKNVRVDARGIHGQVATAWIPTLKVHRVMVIDDHATKDEMQKLALKMARPDTVKLSVLSAKMAAERLSDKSSYPGEEILIILLKISTLKALKDLGYFFDEVNMGNIPNRPGTSSYGKTINLTNDETAIVRDLIKSGTCFSAQLVPGDTKADFSKIINKEG